MAKIPDIYFQSPRLKDPEEAREMAAFVAKVQSLFLDLYTKVNKAKVLTSAPTASELETIGDNLGNVYSEVAILDNATQTNRKLYYKEKAGNLRLIDSA